MSQPFDFLTFPLRGSHLIEASAGTGKTYSLALLYLRLILGHGQDRPLLPKEILVVTYTDAAAQELRDRIRARLVEAAAFFSQALATENADEALRRLGESIDISLWPQSAWRLRLAAESMDEASISTIHSWCHRLLGQYAFETKGLFNRALVTDSTDLLDVVVKDYWRSHFYRLGVDDITKVQGCFMTPDALRVSLKGVVANPSTRLSYAGKRIPHISFSDILAELAAQAQYEREAQRLLEQCRRAWRDDWPQVADYLRSLRPRLNGSVHDSAKEEKFDTLLAAIEAWAHRDAELPKKLLKFATGAFSFKAGQAVEVSPFAAFDATRDYAQWQAQAPQSETDLSLNAMILAHARDWVAPELARRKRQRAEMGFNDLLTELWRALQQDPTLATTLAALFPVAMIDEFQDTDPIQFGIFDAIYQVASNHQHTGLIMIGDPKQAIYSFRGADIYTYLMAKRACAGSPPRHYTLTTNFRSSRAVVEACNYLFSYAQQQHRGAFRFRHEGEDDPIPYPVVSAHGKETECYDTTGPMPALRLFPVFAQADDHGALIGAEEYRRLSAEMAASQVVRWLEGARQARVGFGRESKVEAPLQPSDIAILVRTGTEADAMRRALRARQVASVYLSDKESVFESAEARDLLLWLKACAEPYHEASVRAALGTNTLGLALAQLAHWREDELAWQAQMQAFVRFRELWQRHGVLAMIVALMHEYQLPSRLLRAAQGGERCLTNLLHLAEWCQQSSVEMTGEQALIRHLAEHINADDQEQIVRLESDADVVKVITIHKSKGLEYPIVMLPFVGAWKSVYKEGALRLSSDKGNSLDIAGHAGYVEGWEQAEDERISEDMRLLYVALTRASHHLWLAVGALKSGNVKKPQVEQSALGYLLNGGQAFADAEAVIEAYRMLSAGCSAIVWQEHPVAISTDALTAQIETALGDARDATGLATFSPWWIASYSAIQVDEQNTKTSLDAPETGRDERVQELWDDVGDAQDEPRNAPQGERDFIHMFPGGAEWGTFLHELIERAAIQQSAFGQGFAAVANDKLLRDQMVQRLCESKNISHLAQGLSAWLAEWLTTAWQFSEVKDASSMPPRALQLASLNMNDVMVEMEFMFSSHRVNTRTLDTLVSTHCLPGHARPAALPTTLNGMMKGFIDAVMLYQGRYYVVDWKSNKLGDDNADYPLLRLREAVLHKRYDLQYVLYTLALHRQLKARLAHYDYDSHMGGAIYVFLRGWQAPSQGLFYDRPSRELIERLDALFMGQED